MLVILEDGVIAIHGFCLLFGLILANFTKYQFIVVLLCCLVRVIFVLIKDYLLILVESSIKVAPVDILGSMER